MKVLLEEFELDIKCLLCLRKLMPFGLLLHRVNGIMLLVAE